MYSSIEIVSAKVAGWAELAVRGGDGGGWRGAEPGGGAAPCTRQEPGPGGEGGRAAAARARVEAGDGGRQRRARHVSRHVLLGLLCLSCF